MAFPIQDRIKDTLYASRRKRWYQRLWGKLLFALISFALVYVVIFITRVIVEYREIASGKVTPEQFVKNFRQDAKVDLLHNSNDPSLGPTDASVTVVMFADYECPYTFQSQPMLKKIMVKYGNDVRIIYKDFPLRAIHPNAQSAAEAGQCAFEQGKFWEFHDELYAHQDKLSEAYYRTVAKDLGLNITKFNECFKTGKYRQQIADDVELGRLLGVRGTPTYFVNGEYFVAGYSTEVDGVFEQAIEYIKAL